MTDSIAVSGPLTTHQRDHIARLVVSGCSTKTIASAVQKNPSTITKLTHPEKGDPDLLERIGVYRSQILRAQASLHFELLEYVDQAKAAIRDGLQATTDPRLRLETAWKLLAKVMPEEAHNLNVNVSGAISVEANIEVEGAMKTIAAHLVDLPQLGDFQKRVVSGPDALPGPPSMIEDTTTPDDGVLNAGD